jgi:hypothetical protein
MTNALQTTQNGQEMSWEVQEKALIQGDLRTLSSAGRVEYYLMVCKSLGLNPLTKPFEYIDLKGLKLYATRNCADQLASIRKINLQILSEQFSPDGKMYIVKVRATLPDKRSTDSTGVVAVGGLQGEAYANALMKAETKAKRRAVLSLCGLSWMDETEVETVPGARPVSVNIDTGEILDAPQAQRGQVDVAAVKNQMLDLLQVGKDRNMSKIDLEDECMRLSEKPIRSLTFEERDNFIEYVKSLPVKATEPVPAGADEPF